MQVYAVYNKISNLVHLFSFPLGFIKLKMFPQSSSSDQLLTIIDHLCFGSTQTGNTFLEHACEVSAGCSSVGRHALCALQ